MLNKTICMILLSIFLSSGISAQIEAPGKPIGISIKNNRSSKINSVSMPTLNMQEILLKDSIGEANGLPYKFGEGINVDLGLDNSGTWETLSDGTRVWRLRIESSGAYSLNLLYDEFWLPEGAKLFLYNEDMSQIAGAFTSNNNKDTRTFATRPIFNDVIYLEYQLPAFVFDEGIIHINSVVHGYKDLLKRVIENFEQPNDSPLKAYEDADNCNVDINCSTGDLSLDDKINMLKHSVVFLLVGNNQYLCSGAIMNNTNADRTPYVLTASHCVIDVNEDGQFDSNEKGGDWIFTFDYENYDCNGNSAFLGNTMVGSTQKAYNLYSDFTLVEIDNNIPANYGAYFAGWYSYNFAPSNDSTFSIHHPDGDVKKYSISANPLISQLGTPVPNSNTWTFSPGNSHWQVYWSQGITEGGSSGAPLFNTNGQVIGQLTAGSSDKHFCFSFDDSTFSDYYGKLSRDMDYTTVNSTSLRIWLDPDYEFNGATYILNGFGDYDNDGILDYEDNCPNVPNNQVDSDNDTIGDECDNCPQVPNTDQTDSNNDGVGDVCIDTDGDGVYDYYDMCPGYNDDDDADNDGIPDACDNCPNTANPGQSNSDADNDGIPDDCDECTDTDGDGYGDTGYLHNECPEDNCPTNYNPDQSPDSCETPVDDYWISLNSNGFQINQFATTPKINTSIVYNNQIIFGGSFGFSLLGWGSTIANNIVTYDGANFGSLGLGVSKIHDIHSSFPDTYVGGEVKAFAEFQGNLIVGGQFIKGTLNDNNETVVPANNIISWNGQSWNQLSFLYNGAERDLDIFLDEYEYGGVFVNALEEYNDKLFIGGTFDRIIPYDNVNSIIAWDGTNVITFGTGCKRDANHVGIINDMAVFNDKLYIAGNFTEIDGVQCNNIACWDGTSWNSVSNNFQGEIISLYSDVDYLRCTGTFIENLSSTNYYYATIKISQNNDVSGYYQWGYDSYPYEGLHFPQTNCLYRYDNDLLTGGDSYLKPTNMFGSSVNGNVNTMIEYNYDLYVAGKFTIAGNKFAKNIAKWTKHNCCIGTRGNIDNSAGDEMDISDLVFIVDFMFYAGPEPDCFEEGDMSGDGLIDISDLLLLQDYMFGNPPASSPINCEL